MIAIKIILLIMAIFLVVAVLLQEGKSEGLSAIGGSGNDSYLGKGKGKGKKKAEKLSMLTTIVAIVFVVVVIILGTFEQRNPKWHPEMPEGTADDPSFVSTTVPATTAAPAKTTVAPATTPAPATTAAPATTQAPATTAAAE